MLFDLKTKIWNAVAQRGWRPEARQAASIAYHDNLDQLYIFGGSGVNGSCRTDVYCCNLGEGRASYKLTEL